MSCDQLFLVYIMHFSLSKGKIETDIIFFEYYLSASSILLVSIAVVATLCAVALFLGHRMTKRNLAKLHKKKLKLIIEIRKIQDLETKVLADLNALRSDGRFTKTRKNQGITAKKDESKEEKNEVR
jgi:hypothetical protein